MDETGQGETRGESHFELFVDEAVDDDLCDGVPLLLVDEERVEDAVVLEHLDGREPRVPALELDCLRKWPKRRFESQLTSGHLESLLGQGAYLAEFLHKEVRAFLVHVADGEKGSQNGQLQPDGLLLSSYLMNTAQLQTRHHQHRVITQKLCK